MKQKIKNIRKNKKGMSTLEFVMCVMIFLTVFTFLADMFLILYKQYVVTSACSEISRQIGIQGGIATTKPENYPGDNDNYLTYSELNSWINSLNEAFFVEDDEVFCEIEYFSDPGDPTSGIVLNPKQNTEPIYLPYGSYVSVTIYYPQSWTYVATLTGFNESKDSWGDKKKSCFSVTKEYVTDYVSWVPEDYTGVTGQHIYDGR